MTYWVLIDENGYYRSNWDNRTYTPKLLLARKFNTEQEAIENKRNGETVKMLRSHYDKIMLRFIHGI